MNEVKAKLTEDGLIQFRCINCFQKKTIPAKLLKTRTHAFRIKCTCKEDLRLMLETRDQMRKETDLDGYYVIISPKEASIAPKKEKTAKSLNKVNCRIKNISIKGLGFSPLGYHRIKTGQYLRILFILDDSKKTFMEKKLLVKSAQNNFIGCQFIDIDREEKDQNLGFYLL